MKLNVEVDCTPEEARQFLGLPDLRPMQDAVMARIQQQMLDGVDALSPEALLRSWMPLAPQTPDQLRDAMTGLFRMFSPLGGTPTGSSGGGTPTKGSGGGRPTKGSGGGTSADPTGSGPR